MTNLNNLFLIFFLFISNTAYSQGAENIMTQNFNQDLYNQLPINIKESKQIIAANEGHVPPYTIYNSVNEMSGLTIDLFNAISQILGIKIVHETVVTIPAILLGIQSGRYDLAVGPITDLPARQAKNDFIAYAASYIAFAVQKGNPKKINSPADMCGNRIAVEAGSQGPELVNKQSEICVAKNKKPVDLMIFKDQPSAVLALKSSRVDAVFGGVSILSYYVAKDNDILELTGEENSAYNPIRHHSIVVAKDSPLGPIILAALQELYANGTYDKIMDKWHMQAAKLDKPGINLAK